jgi:hypothetical protein
MAWTSVFLKGKRRNVAAQGSALNQLEPIEERGGELTRSSKWKSGKGCSVLTTHLTARIRLMARPPYSSFIQRFGDSFLPGSYLHLTVEKAGHCWDNIR